MAREVGSSGKIYSVEPDRARFQQLVANRRIKELEQIQPLWYEVGQTTAVPSTPESSEQRTLDSFHFDRVKLIRIALADREDEILSGARRLLAESRPVIILNIRGSSQDSSEAMLSRLAHTRGLLGSLGYRMTRLKSEDTWVAHPIDLDANGQNLIFLDLGASWARDALARGFSEDEEKWPENWVWNQEVETETWLFLEEVDTGSYVLGFRAEAFDPIAPVQAQVYLNGSELGSLSLRSGFTGVELSVPAGLLKRGRNVLTLRFSKTGTPAQLIPGSDDQRWLSARFDCLWLVPER